MVFAFVWRKGSDDILSLPLSIDLFAHLSHTHPMFDFGKCLLDGIEVRRVRLQEQELCFRSYVAMTRHRIDMRLYVNTKDRSV